MGLFSGRSGGGRAASQRDTDIGRLAEIGRARYRDGQFPDVSDFYLPAVIAGGAQAAVGQDLTDRLVTAVKATHDGWVAAGALYVAIDYDGADFSTRFGSQCVIDPALRLFASQGFTSGHIPPFLIDRWLTLTES